MHSLLCLLILQVLLVVGFDGDHVFGLLVRRSSNNSEGTLADLQVYLKFIELKWLLVWILLSSCVDQIPEIAQGD